MGEVIVITSGKGGVGKTTTRKSSGDRYRSPGFAIWMWLWAWKNRIVYNLVDVIEGGCRPKQALIMISCFPKLHLLQCKHRQRDKTAISPEQMKAVEELKTEFRLYFAGLPGRNRAGVPKCDCRS